jgi:hypothetical protein
VTQCPRPHCSPEMRRHEKAAPGACGGHWNLFPREASFRWTVLPRDAEAARARPLNYLILVSRREEFHAKLYDTCSPPQHPFIPYEQIERRPWLAICRIASAICPIVYPSEVLAITHRLSKATVKRQTDTLPIEAPDVIDVGFSHYHAQTLFHRRHVSDLKSRPAEQRLSPERLKTIRAALGAVMVAAGLSQFG